MLGLSFMMFLDAASAVCRSRPASSAGRTTMRARNTRFARWRLRALQPLQLSRSAVHGQGSWRNHFPCACV